MGYTLIIGEAEIDWNEDGVQIDAAVAEHPDAPAFGEPTDRQNQRWPSYSSWVNFCREVGITEVVMNARNGGSDAYRLPDGKHLSCLMPSHPGCAPVTRQHLQYLEEKIGDYRRRNPDHRAEYPPPKPDAKPIAGNGNWFRNEDLVEDSRFDGNLCRAEWLLYWVKWAVENCEKPVFVNS